MITAEITVREPAEPAAAALYQAAQPELMNTPRTILMARQEKDAVIFTIESKDSTAFRAGVNAVIQIITVFEKMSQLNRIN